MTSSSHWLLLSAVLLLTELLAPCHADFTLTVLHTNDVHARYEQFNKYGSTCSDAESQNSECFGGYARLVTAVKKLRGEYPISLFLDGGDQYQGTVWFYKYGANITSTMMNWAQYDVVTIGNHEFDRGVEGLVPHLRAVKFNVVSSNIDASRAPELQGLFNKSVVKEVAGRRVGIVGYTTEDTPFISEPGNLTFKSVIDSVTAEVKRLKGEGIDIIIALGHAGYTVDLEVAKIPDVDIVVGGHTDTFLYTGTPPSIEVPVDVYPKVVNRSDGSALVVQEFTWAKYLGVLHVTFNERGEVVNYSGNPWLLNVSVVPDPNTTKVLEPYKLGLDASIQEVVGRTLVKLEGDRTVCRREECNLGNVFADAFVYQNLRYPTASEWNDVAIAVVNGGSVRASIKKGDITVGDVMSVMPFANTIDTGRLAGRFLLEAFEHSVKSLSPCVQSDLGGGFLQISGLKVVYDLRRAAGKRVVSLSALCTACDVPRYEPVIPDKMYKLVLTSFMVRGGDGYDVIAKNLKNYTKIENLDSDVLTRYIREKKLIYQGLEGRTTFLDGSNRCDTSSGAEGGRGPRSLAAVLVLTLLARVCGL